MSCWLLWRIYAIGSFVSSEPVIHSSRLLVVQVGWVLHRAAAAEQCRAMLGFVPEAPAEIPESLIPVDLCLHIYAGGLVSTVPKELG